jgi:hypothetical protein
MVMPLKNEYGPISRDSLEDKPLNLSQDNAFFSEKQRNFPLAQGPIRKHLLSVLNLVLLLIQIALIGWYIRKIVSRRSETIEMEYGRNYDYMSLDHKYDYLWEQDVAANEAGIIVLKDHGGKYKEIEHGAISM